MFMILKNEAVVMPTATLPPSAVAHLLGAALTETNRGHKDWLCHCFRQDDDNFLWSIGKAIIGAVCFVCGAIITAATFVVKAVQCDDLDCIAKAVEHAGGAWRCRRYCKGRTLQLGTLTADTKPRLIHAPGA